MKGVTILNNDLTFGLLDVLSALGDAGSASTWRLESVECFGGEEAEVLHAASDEGTVVSGDQLLKLAKGITQVVEGEFAGSLGEEDPWIIVRAIDGAAYDVISKRAATLDVVRKSWTQVVEIADEDL